jgi:hypothetical protein
MERMGDNDDDKSADFSNRPPSDFSMIASFNFGSSQRVVKDQLCIFESDAMLVNVGIRLSRIPLELDVLCHWRGPCPRMTVNPPADKRQR